MAPRWKVSYLITVLIVLSVVTFVLDYQQLHLIPKLKLSFLYPFHTSVPELAIRLHPELHSQRRPQTLHIRWEITQGHRSPDGVRKLVYLINGEF